MPRPLRFLPPGTVAHVVNRGNDKRRLFSSAREFEDFMGLVVWTKRRVPVRIPAYCVMSNHWHFAFWVEREGDVSEFLHRLTTTHAKSWRQRTNTVGEGHVYQDRFHSSNVYTERYYFNLVRYIEQNPFRASLVEASKDWRWSSLAERLGYPRCILDEGPTPLPTDWVRMVDDTIEEQTLAEIRKSLQRH